MRNMRSMLSPSRVLTTVRIVGLLGTCICAVYYPLYTSPTRYDESNYSPRKLGDITEKPYYTAEKNPRQRRIQTKYTLAINSRRREQKYRATSPSRGVEPCEKERKKNTGTCHGSEGTAP
jgi:hypothetical protein